MPASMTGFGEGQAVGSRHRIRVVVQTYNHRYLDLACRVPEAFRGLEPALREAVETRLSRGRCEVTVSASALESAATSPPMRVDRGLVERLVAAGRELAPLGIAPALTWGELLRVPGVVVTEREALVEAADREAALAALAQALAEVEATRASEGTKLSAALEPVLASLGALAEEAACRREAMRPELFATLRARLAELLTASALPEDRLALEAALLVDKSDIAEEIARLRAHVSAAQQVLLTPAGTPVGKRLDFLAQEMAREVNTWTSKSRDLDLVRPGLEAKLWCERFREQVQNLE